MLISCFINISLCKFVTAFQRMSDKGITNKKGERASNFMIPHNQFKIHVSLENFQILKLCGGGGVQSQNNTGENHHDLFLEHL